MEVSLLRTINIFEGLTDEELEKIFKLARIKLYAKDNLILEEGRLGGALHVIIKGKVKVTKKMEGSPKDKLITAFGPQAIFGEMSLFDNLPYSANIIATEETRCLVVPKEPFDKMLQQDLKLAHKILTQIITILSQRLRNTNEELVAITSWKDRIKQKQDKNA
ncbi:cyclic nucleotide-binding domain-containing protein [bacterium]|nr:cyclic nucleotide-binding domain-containing protein [bacterium]